MMKTYIMKKELNPVGPLTSGPLEGKMLVPGKEYREGDFPKAYIHMFDEVKSGLSQSTAEKGGGKRQKQKAPLAEDAEDTEV